MISGKFSTFQNIADVHGFARAMKEMLRWVICLINGRNFNSRFEIERQWVQSLEGRESVSGVEIGVRYGQNAEFLLKMLNIKQLYLIDPYDAYDEYLEDWDERMMSEAEEIARNRLEPYDSVKFIKEYSGEALSELEGDFDFVYIDGNHEYEYVKQDLTNYYPMVKAGGILAGHDYTGMWPGVAKAVDEFGQVKGLQIKTDLWGDWYIEKPVGTANNS